MLHFHFSVRFSTECYRVRLKMAISASNHMHLWHLCLFVHNTNEFFLLLSKFKFGPQVNFRFSNLEKLQVVTQSYAEYSLVDKFGDDDVRVRLQLDLHGPVQPLNRLRTAPQSLSRSSRKTSRGQIPTGLRATLRQRASTCSSKGYLFTRFVTYECFRASSP